ncbi:hypothetical protein GCM10012289_24070 [Nonomuraea cavernae]|uniref:Uncharacterized protein n=2 Tax=Nonomuraea cavernae TaxID=2045107 RepID=A0A917YXX8_9ACTN|nr:hypothetical protein GCM10012289_24070 [Nonomuraea cavernae]
MVVGFALLGVGLVIGVLLALADPVLLSRVNGEYAEGGSGRHLDRSAVVRLAERGGPGRDERAAA